MEVAARLHHYHGGGVAAVVAPVCRGRWRCWRFGRRIGAGDAGTLAGWRLRVDGTVASGGGGAGGGPAIRHVQVYRARRSVGPVEWCAGGAAGPAAIGNSFITWATVGDRRGPLN